LFLMSETFCLRSRGRVRLDAWCLRHTCARGLVCAPPCIVPPQHCAPHPIWSRTGGRMSPSKISRLFKTASNIPEQALIDQYSLQDTQSSENSSTEQRQGQKQTHSPVVPDINASGIVRPKTEALLTLFPVEPPRDSHLSLPLSKPPPSQSMPLSRDAEEDSSFSRRILAYRSQCGQIR